MLWQTWFIWKFINTPLPDTNPFHKLPTPASRLIIQRPNTFFSSLTALFILVTISLSCMGGLVALWVFFLFNGGNATFVLLMPYILFYMAVGVSIAFKIINRMGKLRTSGISDLVGVTPYGKEQGMWVIACITYQRMEWVKIVIIIIKELAKVIAFFWSLMIFIGVFGLLINFETPVNSVNQFEQLVSEMVNWVFLLLVMVLFFIHALVMGYLVGIWSSHIPTDGISRVGMGISGVLGSQLMLYLVVYIALYTALPNLFMSSGWSKFFMLPFLQFIGTILLIEIQVRGICHLLAYQAGMSISDWRSELGVWQK